MYLRLFYADELLGWNREEWPTYLFWSFVVWASCSAIMLAIRQNFQRQLGLMAVDIIATMSFMCIPTGILLFSLAGRQTTSPLSPGLHEMNKPGCCSQGLVFPRSVVPRLLQPADLETNGAGRYDGGKDFQRWRLCKVGHRATAFTAHRSD